MSSKIAATTADLFDKLTGTRARIAQAEQEAAELEREMIWARGQERRGRLEALGAAAQLLAEGAADRAAELAEVRAAITANVARAHELAATYNEQLGELRRQISAEGVRPHPGGNVPPSPADGAVAPTGDGVLVVGVRIHSVEPVGLVEQAVRDGQRPGTAPEVGPPQLVTEVPPLPGPFWRVRENGRVLMADKQPNAGCVQITRPEYLAAVWGLDLRDLPSDVLAELTATERAGLAVELMPADTGGAA